LGHESSPFEKYEIHNTRGRKQERSTRIFGDDGLKYAESQPLSPDARIWRSKSSRISSITEHLWEKHENSVSPIQSKLQILGLQIRWSDSDNQMSHASMSLFGVH